MTILRARWLAAAVALLMVAGACSGTPEAETTAATDAPTTAAPATTEPVTAEPTPTTTSVGDEPADTATDTQATVETTTSSTTEAEAAESDEDQSAAEDGDTSTEPTESDTSEPTSGDESETDESTEGDKGQPDDTPEADEAAQPYWKYRSVGTAFHDSAFYDHNQIKALFPHCPPPPGGSLAEWIDEVFDYWDNTYARWDTESQLVEGSDGRSYRIATGWWTDEQLEMFRPGDGITAASARQHADYWADENYLTVWPAGGVPSGVGIAERYVAFWPRQSADGRYTFENLYRRLESIGYRDTDDDRPTAREALAVIRDDGVPGYSPNPAGINVGAVLVDWTVTRYQFPPTTREPAAWAMRTLLEERDPVCVANQMRSVCDYDGDDLADIIGEQATQVLGRDHRFGRVLWSLVCPEA